MKVCVTADFHGAPLPPIPDCDLLLIAGDVGFKESFGRGPVFTPAGMMDEVREWLGGQHTVVVGGNHDFDETPFQQLHEEGLWTYLRDEAVEIAGVKVWGSPWSPRFGNWAWMAEDHALHNKYADIPDDVEIIVSHGPPYGFGDRTLDYGRGRQHVGSEALLERARALPKLRLIACGHIHPAYGSTYIPDSNTYDKHAVVVVNGSWVDNSYSPGNPPIVVEL